MHRNTVPQVAFKTRVRDENVGGDNPFRWQDITTDDIFKGRKVVIERLFVEPEFSDNCPTDLFDVSDAGTMLAVLKGKQAPAAKPARRAFVG